MSKLKQCIYTVILLLTCLMASPFIYKQIWDSSQAKKPKAGAKEPSVSASEPAEKPSDAQDATAATDGQGNTAATADPGTTTEPAAQPTTEASPVTYVSSGPEYFNDALFIGDSRTVGIRDYGGLKNADYFCNIGLSAYQIDNTTIDGQTVWGRLNAKKYGKIYVMLGINEVGNDIDGTFAKFRKLIDGIREVQPDALVYIQGNLHVASYAETSIISNARIDLLNSRIRELADYKKIFYLEVNSLFDDENGALTADFTSDGTHVLAKYYITWTDWLCENTVSPDGSTPAKESSTFASEAAAEAETTTQNKKPQNEEFSNQ
ncbi:MAG: hypothetical protein IKH78_10945 [Ruminococcus sp.]|nr:hypothetical protein [Ruminococcus sp.]